MKKNVRNFIRDNRGIIIFAVGELTVIGAAYLLGYDRHKTNMEKFNKAMNDYSVTIGSNNKEYIKALRNYFSVNSDDMISEINSINSGNGEQIADFMKSVVNSEDHYNVLIEKLK